MDLFYLCAGSFEYINKISCELNIANKCVKIENKANNLAVLYHSTFNDNNSFEIKNYDNLLLIYHGNLYNRTDIIREYDYENKHNSICDIIIDLYSNVGITKTMSILDGEFIFLLYDQQEKILYFSGDISNRFPLFFNYNELSIILTNTPSHINNKKSELVLPGYIFKYSLSVGLLQKRKYLNDKDESIVINEEYIYNILQNSIIKRIKTLTSTTNSNESIGFIVSGKHNSELVLNIALHYYYTEFIKEVDKLCPNGGHFRDIESSYKAADEKRIKPTIFTVGIDINDDNIARAILIIERMKKVYGHTSFEWVPIIISLSDQTYYLEKTKQLLQKNNINILQNILPIYAALDYIKKNTQIKTVIIEDFNETIKDDVKMLTVDDNTTATKQIIETSIYDIANSDYKLNIQFPLLDYKLVEVLHMDLFSDTSLNIDIDVQKNKNSFMRRIREVCVAKNILQNNIYKE